MINLSETKKQLDAVKPFINKELEPGTHVCTINSISYRKNNFDEEGLHVTLNLEGPEITDEGFEGFNIDNNDPSKGKYKGAVGKVDLQKYAYNSKDGTSKSGRKFSINRDLSIQSALNNLAKALGKDREVMEGEVEDIVAVIKKASDVLSGSKIRIVIAGKEYESKGYIHYNLYLPKFVKGKDIYQAVDKNPELLQEFDENTMVTKLAKTSATQQPKPTTIDDFDVSSADDLPF